MECMNPHGTLPAETEPGTVALRVSDPDRVATFYERVIGLARRDTDDRTVLAAGEEPLVVLLHDDEARARAADEVGLFHTAFLVPDRPALGDALSRIESEWSLDGASDHLVSEALYCTDPEGNGVEVYRDYPRERWPVDPDGTVGIGTEPLDLDGVRGAAGGAARAPPATTVGHVHLEVSALAASERFYGETVGLGVKRRLGGRASFLAAGDYHHHLGLNVWGGRSTPGSGRGLAWFELRVPTVAAMEAVRARVADEHLHPTDGQGIELTDPDGIRLRLSVAGEVSAERGCERV